VAVVRTQQLTDCSLGIAMLAREGKSAGTYAHNLFNRFERRIGGRDRGQSHLAEWGATMCKETDVEATLENCRALISQIIAGLSAEEPFVDASSATELLLCLERAASALKKAAPRPRKRGGTKLALNFH